jgi:hypothetical protein
VCDLVFGYNLGKFTGEYFLEPVIWKMKSCLGGWDVRIFAHFLALALRVRRSFHLSPRLLLTKRLCRHFYTITCILRGLQLSFFTPVFLDGC